MILGICAGEGQSTSIWSLSLHHDSYEPFFSLLFTSYDYIRYNPSFALYGRNGNHEVLRYKSFKTAG